MPGIRGSCSCSGSPGSAGEGSGTGSPSRASADHGKCVQGMQREQEVTPPWRKKDGGGGVGHAGLGRRSRQSLAHRPGLHVWERNTHAGGSLRSAARLPCLGQRPPVGVLCLGPSGETWSWLQGARRPSRLIPPSSVAAAAAVTAVTRASYAAPCWCQRGSFCCKPIL